MQEKPGSSVHFNNYLALLKGFDPTVEGMIVFDDQACLVWQDSNDVPEPERVEPALEKFKDGGSDSALVSLDDDLDLELVNLHGQYGEVMLTLCLLRGATHKKVQAIAANENIALLNEFLGVEYAQSQVIVSKEDELNYMTDELTRRYEELNLIYKAEDQAINIYHGRELLRQLVTNTSRFLNVDIIILYIAGKDIAMHKYKDDEPLLESGKLLGYLRDSVFPFLETAQGSVVINHADDAKKCGFEEVVPFKHAVSPIVNAESQVIGLLAIASQEAGEDFTNSDRNLLDVMAKKASKITQSHFDPLTGLENSNSFELIIGDLLKQTRDTGIKHSIANIDIDRMAVVNDISGRDAGDMLIKEIGQKLAGMVRSRDVVARIGSDKFGVLLENCDLSTARVVMKKMATAISAIDFKWEDVPHEVSVSIGIAPVSTETKSVTSLLNAAETARNVSKERGRNMIHVLDLDDRDLLIRKEQIRRVGQIQSALRDDRFILYGQLIKPLKENNGTSHYEILIRMHDEDGAMVPPGIFLPAAESFYLMESLDYWVINKAFSQLDEHKRETGQRCEVSINLSGQSLKEPLSFAAFVENKLEHHQLDARDICFEITESAAIANIDDAQIFMKLVSDFGCKFSLDDFGTGLSSFSYLKNLKVDYLKIDGCFVTDILEDTVSASMVAAINQVGHAMQLKTIAEYVENDKVAQKLNEIGVDYVQGYAVGKPAPLAEILSGQYDSKSKSRSA